MQSGFSVHRLRWLLALSLGLHAILLTLLPPALFEANDVAPPGRSMQAVMVAAASTSGKAMPDPLPAPVAPAPAGKKVLRAEAPHAPATPVPPPVEAAAPGPRPSSGGPLAAPAESAPAPVQVQAVGADGLREYRLALAREARRFKQEYDRKYDAMERERRRGWEGRVEMTVRSRSGTPVPAVALAHSSGYPQLDEQALELIGRAVQTTTLPSALQGQAFALPVTLEFRMRSE